MNNHALRRNYRGFLSLATIPFLLSIITPMLAMVVTLITKGFGSFSLGMIVVGIAIALSFRAIYLYPVKDVRLVSQKAWDRIQQWDPYLWPDRQILVAQNDMKLPSTSGLKNDVILNPSFVKRLEDKIDPVDEVILLHELGHAINKDSLYVTILGTTLRAGVISIGIIWLFVILWNTPGILLGMTVNSGNYVLDSYFILGLIGTPLGVSITILLFLLPTFLVQRFIQRICEFEADSFAVVMQGTDKFLIKALIQAELRKLKRAPDKNLVKRDDEASFMDIEKMHKSIPGILKKLFSTHPTALERKNAARGDMETSSIKTASFTIGVIALLWIAYVGKMDTVGAVNTIFFFGSLGLANYAIANVLVSENSMTRIIWNEARNLGLVFLGLITGIGFVMGYAYILSILINLSGNTWTFFTIDHLELASIQESLPALIKSILVGLGWLWLFLVLNDHSAKDLLTWYTSPYLKESPRTVSATIAIINFVVVLSLRYLAGTASALTCLGQVICIPILVLIFFRPWLFFYRFANRYRHICPSCKQKIAGDYRLGMVCPHCTHPLNQWLFERRPGKKYEIPYYIFFWLFTNEKVQKWANSK